MANQCPKCKMTFEDNPKFCPGCGAPIASAPDDPSKNEPAEPKQTALAPPAAEKRVFVLRERKYGDTAQYDDAGDDKPNRSDDPAPAPKAGVSLYLSVIALILSIAAIVLVVIFAVIPSGQSSSDTASPTEPPTLAPTQAPTEPPIAGSYKVSQIKSDDTGSGVILLRSATLELHSDYTGTLNMSSVKLCDVILDKSSDTVEFMNTTCAYTFDGSILTIDYNGATLVFKKE